MYVIDSEQHVIEVCKKDALSMFSNSYGLLLTSGFSIYLKKGKICGIALDFRNISERKRKQIHTVRNSL